MGLSLGVVRADKEQGGGEEVVGDAVAVLPLVRAVEQPEFGGGAGEHECPKEPPDDFGAGVWGAADDKRGLQEPAVEREPEPETFGQGDGAAVLGEVVLPEVEGEGGEEGEKGEQAVGGHGWGDVERMEWGWFCWILATLNYVSGCLWHGAATARCQMAIVCGGRCVGEPPTLHLGFRLPLGVRHGVHSFAKSRCYKNSSCISLLPASGGGLFSSSALRHASMAGSSRSAWLR